MVVGSAAGCCGGPAGSSRERQLPVSAMGPENQKRTRFGSIFSFRDTPFARGWSFYRRNGSRGRGLCGRGIGARRELWLRRLLLFAAAEEAAQTSFHLG